MIGFRLMAVFTFQCAKCSTVQEWELEGDCVVAFVDPSGSVEAKRNAIQPVYDKIKADGWGSVLNADGTESEAIACPACLVPVAAVAPASAVEP